MTYSNPRLALVTATRGAFALIAVGVVLQVFLAGLALFGTEGFDTHKASGWIVHTIGIAAFVLAIAGPRTRVAILGAFGLFALNTIQIEVVTADTAAVAALHPTLALAVLGLALWLTQQVRPR